MLYRLLILPVVLLADLPAIPPVLVPQTDDDHLQIPWPNDPTVWQSNLPFSRWVAGKFSTVPGGDAIGIRGRRLYLVEGFQFMGALVPFDPLTSLNFAGTTVFDVAVLSGAGSSGRDMVLTVDSRNGLVEHDFVPPGLETPSSFASTVIDASSTWKGMIRVLTADLDGDGVARDIVGVTPNNQIRTKIHDGAGYVPGTTFDYPTPVRGALVCDYDGIGGPDLVAMCDEIEIRPLDGSPAFDSVPIEADAITFVPRSLDAAGDLLVVAYTTVGSESMLQLCHSGGNSQDPLRLEISPSPGMGPRDLDVVAMITGDWNEDNVIGSNYLTDILIAHHSFPQTVVLLRDYDTGEYSAAESGIDRVAFEDNPGTAYVPQNNGIPVFWTDDGYDSNVVLHPADSEDALAIAISTAAVELETGFTGDGAGRVHSVGYDPSLSKLYVRFSLAEGVTLDDYSHMRVVYWQQYEENGDVDGQAEHTWHVLPDPGESDGGPFQLEIDMAAGHSFWPPTADGWGDTGPLFWVSLSFIDADFPTQSIRLETGRTNLGWRMQPGLIGDDGENYDEYLIQFPYKVEIQDLVDLTSGTESGTGGADFGAVILTRYLPAFDVLLPPQVPEAYLGPAIY